MSAGNWKGEQGAQGIKSTQPFFTESWCAEITGLALPGSRRMFHPLQIWSSALRDRSLTKNYNGRAGEAAELRWLPIRELVSGDGSPGGSQDAWHQGVRQGPGRRQRRASQQNHRGLCHYRLGGVCLPAQQAGAILKSGARTLHSVWAPYWSQAPGLGPALPPHSGMHVCFMQGIPIVKNIIWTATRWSCLPLPDRKSKVIFAPDSRPVAL